MDADLDTLLTALYCFTDDLLITRRLPGRPKRLTDAELVCLAVAQVLLNRPSEAGWLRYARKHLFGMFPLPAETVRLEQTTTRGRTTDRPCHPRTRADHPDQRGPVTADRLHPGGVRAVPPDRETFGPGWRGRLRLLRLPLPPPAPGSNATTSPRRSSVACCACGSGSRRFSTRSRASCPWNSTAPVKQTGSTPESGNAYWPWPPLSGTTPIGAPRKRSPIAYDH